MSANTRLSKKASSTDKYTKSPNNNCSKGKKLKNEENDVKSKLKITITKHLSVPCSGLYEDILKKALIVCKDPSHKQNDFQDQLIDSKIEASTGVKKKVIFS